KRLFWHFSPGFPYILYTERTRSSPRNRFRGGEREEQEKALELAHLLGELPRRLHGHLMLRSPYPPAPALLARAAQDTRNQLHRPQAIPVHIPVSPFFAMSMFGIYN